MCDVIRWPIIGREPAENWAEAVSKAAVGCVSRASVSTQTDGIEHGSTWLPGVDQDPDAYFHDLEECGDQFQLDFVPYRSLTRHNAEYVNYVVASK